MSVRLRRLTADYEKISSVFTGDTRIRVMKTLGNPPEKYQIQFLVKGVQKDPASQEVKRHSSFIAEIVLTAAYPRLPPQCRMLTPVFHPNIAPHAICIGDHWAAGESLPRLIVRIAEMLSYQSYNVKSPLNGEAARWVEKHRHRLPVDSFDFGSLLETGEAVARTAEGELKAAGECANCGRREGQLEVCLNQHNTCGDCALRCDHCQALLCLKCSLTPCGLCGATACHRCMYRCGACQRAVCTSHTGECHLCGRRACSDCLVRCDGCRGLTCVADIRKVETPEGRSYRCTTCAA